MLFCYLVKTEFSFFWENIVLIFVYKWRHKQVSVWNSASKALLISETDISVNINTFSGQL